MFASIDCTIGNQEDTEGFDPDSMNGDTKIIVDCYREKGYVPFPYTAKIL